MSEQQAYKQAVELVFPKDAGKQIKETMSRLVVADLSLAMGGLFLTDQPVAAPAGPSKEEIDSAYKDWTEYTPEPMPARQHPM